MERWIVLSACQTLGVANSLSLLNPDVSIEPCDIWRFRNEAAHWSAHLADYDCIFVNDEVSELGLVEFAQLPRVVRLPAINFAGYHPDLCYVVSAGRNVHTPLGDYHSIIAFAGFKQGLSEADTLAPYNARTFEGAGYMDMWGIDKAHLMNLFRHYGYDLSAAFRQWGMREGFMHSVNHPRIECLYGLARVATTKAGRTPVDSPARPHDNLRNAQIFPVYPEIAEACGVERSTLFKVAGQYRLLPLQEFVRASFEAYRSHGAGTLDTAEQFKGRHDAILAAI